MGCWNGTCMISNLPILSGDKVKLIILQEGNETDVRNDISGVCYSTDIMRPAFYALSGSYNSYGAIEEIVEDVNYNLMLEYLKSNYIKFNSDGESCDVTIENLICGIERSKFEQFKVKTKNNKWIRGGYGFVMIRQDIWDEILSNYKFNILSPQCKEKQLTNILIYLEEFINLKGKENKSDEEIINMLELNNDINSELRKFFNGLFQEVSFKNTQMYIDTFINAIINDDHEIKNSFINTSYEMLKIIHFVESIRKPWFSQSGSGSQDENWESYKILASKILEICNEEITEYDENE